MTNIFKILTSCALFAGIFFLFQNKENKLPQPADTIVLNNEENSEGQLRREDWIESMHRSAPGENWRKYEYQTQMQRHKERKIATLNANLRNGDMTDTIAGGALIGKWKERGSNNQAGSVFDVEYDATADKLWLISAGGTLWRGSRDGSQWEVVNQDLQFSPGTLKFLTTDNGRRLIANINNIPHYSDDDGLTWIASTGINILDSWGESSQTQFVGDEQKIYIVSKADYWSDYRIYASNDLGENYTQIGAYTGTDGGVRSIALCNPYHSDLLYFLRRTNNAVQLWQINTDDNSSELLNSSSDFLANNAINLAATVTETDTLFYSFDENNTVFKSTDFGASWTEQGQIPIAPWGVGMYLSPSNSDALFTGGVNAYRSLDGGQSWDLINDWAEYYNDVEGKLHADIMAFNEFTSNDGQVFNLCSNHGGLSISFDYHATHDNIGMSGLNVGQYYSVKSNPADPSYIFAGSQDQGMQRAQDNGSSNPINFNQIISGDYGHVVFTNGGDNFWTVYPGGWVSYYHNANFGGITADYTLESENESVWLPPMHATNKDSETAIYMAGGNSSGGSGSYLLKLTYNNGIINTSQFDYDFREFSGTEVSAVEVSEINPDYIYTATTNGRFFYSQDGGTSWEQNVNFLNEGHYLYGQSIYASTSDLETVYLAGSGYSNSPVFRSTDGGEFFSNFSEGLPPTLVFEITANADETMLFAATEAGPYVYIFEEEKWFDMSGLCAPTQTYWSVEYIESLNTIRYGTYGRGIWDFEIDTEMVSSIVSNKEQPLLTIYPNPTQDYFSIKNTQLSGDLTVSDLSGKLVKQMNLTEGNNRFFIGDLSPGTYLVTVRNEGKIWSGKLMKK